MRTEVCAEAGVGHGGDLTIALKMIDAAKAAGADIVKFQTYCPEDAIHPNHKDFTLLKQWALPLKDFITLKRHCDDLGIEFLSTPGDVSSLKFLVDMVGVRRIKIGSDDLTYRPLIEAAAATKKPLIVSTGMATLGEIWSIFPLIKGRGTILLHCVSAYPCAYKDANLKAIPSLEGEFGCEVGYSDHCQGYLACLAAVTLGAVMVEKHFELANHSGPDHDVSINEFLLAKMVKRIREVEVMLGTGRKEPCAAERANIPALRKRADGRKLA